MIQFMKNWYTAKKTQMQLKALFYRLITAFLDNQKELTELIHNLYLALKDTPAEELQQKVIEQMAVLAQEANQKQ